MTTKKKEDILSKGWILENYEDTYTVIDFVDKRESVILKDCKDSNFIIKGKINRLSIESCNNIRVSIDHVISVVEIYKTKDSDCFVDNANIIQIDRSENIKIVYLNRSNNYIVTDNCDNIKIDFLTKDYVINNSKEQQVTYVNQLKTVKSNELRKDGYIVF
jgi:hypothetical protein